MMKYFALARSDAVIGQREISRESNACVFIAYPGGQGERRELKRGDDRGYFDTWSEARDFLLSIEKCKIATLTRELASRQGNVRKIQEMTE